MALLKYSKSATYPTSNTYQNSYIILHVVRLWLYDVILYDILWLTQLRLFWMTSLIVPRVETIFAEHTAPGQFLERCFYSIHLDIQTKTVMFRVFIVLYRLLCCLKTDSNAHMTHKFSVPKQSSALSLESKRRARRPRRALYGHCACRALLTCQCAFARWLKSIHGVKQVHPNS